MVYKNILHAVGGTGIISNKLPYSEGRYYTCFRNVIITENNVFHEKDVEFVNKRATAKDSFAALIGLLEFYYQLQLVTH